MKTHSTALAIALVLCTEGPSIAAEYAPGEIPTFSISPGAAKPSNQKTKPFPTPQTGGPVRPQTNIADTSEFISFDGVTTLVPKGAILNRPEALRSHIVKDPRGKFLIWWDFFARNRARLTTFEVTLEEATGAKPIDPKALALAIRSNTIVVATIHGNPSSVNVPVQDPAKILAAQSQLKP